VLARGGEDEVGPLDELSCQGCGPMLTILRAEFVGDSAHRCTHRRAYRRVRTRA
jgi:hypothetical protein